MAEKRRFSRTVVVVQHDSDKPKVYIERWYSEVYDKIITEMHVEYRDKSTLIFMDDDDLMNVMKGLLGIEEEDE